jgi:hypothetical protein
MTFTTQIRVAAALPFLIAAGACSDSHSQGGAGALGDAKGSAGAGANGGAGTSAWRQDLPNPLLPAFPGGGTSPVAQPLPNGKICDAVALEGPVPDQVGQCFFDDQDRVAATLEQVLECAEEGTTNTVHLRLTFQPWFVDNTYGDNAIGWSREDRAAADPAAAAPKMQDAPMIRMDKKPPKMTGKDAMPKPPMMGKGPNGHSFMDLLGSDHAEFIVTDRDGKLVMQFKLDYVSEDPSRPSGYGSLGVLGGDGKMIAGDPDDVVQWMTSIDRNLNERGYASYTADSPATDAAYTPNADTPEWDYRVVYEAWIDLDAFGSVGFEGATIEYVHASPSKTANHTIEVTPGDCPPCGENPDDDCGGGPPPESPDAGSNTECIDSASGDDSACHVD